METNLFLQMYPLNLKVIIQAKNNIGMSPSSHIKFEANWSRGSDMQTKKMQIDEQEIF